MITCYRITDMQFTGVDRFDACPPGWTTVPPPLADEPPAGMSYRWDGEGWYLGLNLLQANQRIATLWAEADALALSLADQNSRARYIVWLIDPATPPEAKALIGQVQAAMDGLWMQYARAKAAILAGEEPAPWVVPDGVPDFWAIADAARLP